MYCLVLEVVLFWIGSTIPTKKVSSGPRDPDYINPHIKQLLHKRKEICKKGSRPTTEAEILFVKINKIICDNRSRRLSEVGDFPARELCAAVKPKSGTNYFSHLNNLHMVKNFLLV